MTLAAPLDPPHPPRAAAAPRPAGLVGRAAAPSSADALPPFAALWALAALFHHAAYPRTAFGVQALLVTLPALWLLLRPSAPGRLALLAAAQLAQVVWLGPSWVSNHWLLTAAVNLGIVGAAGWLLVRGRRDGAGALPAGALVDGFAPAARVTLLVLYFFGVFQKLNTDYLNPSSSCATTQYAQILAEYPILPSGPVVGYLTIYGTLAVEALIATMLVARRTRLLGVALGALFHAMLSANPSWVFYDFTSALLPLYFLFIPLDYLGTLGERPGTTGGPWAAFARVTRPALVALAVVLAAAAVLGVRPTAPWQVNALQETARVTFFGYLATLLVVLWRVTRRTDVVGRSDALVRLVPRPALVLLAPAIFFLNGFSPYLGFKTEASVTMFSNLRTEEGRTNHLLMGWVPRLWDYQEDAVRVVASSETGLARIARREQRLPWYEFRARAARYPGASVTYERGGARVEVARIGDDPALSVAPPRWERAVLRFRAYEPWGVPQRCHH